MAAPVDQEKTEDQTLCLLLVVPSYLGGRAISRSWGCFQALQFSRIPPPLRRLAPVPRLLMTAISNV